MNKMDERIFCIEPEYIPEVTNLNGVISLSHEEVDDLFNRFEQHAFWERRGEVENLPEVKQIIPYTVILRKEMILGYKRLSGSGEQRLVDQYSIGFGGHISDEHKSITNPHELIRTSIIRELKEEIGLTSFHGPYIQGLLYAGDSERVVDLVHLGIVNFVFPFEIPKSTERDVLTDPILFNFFELDGITREKNFERWSELTIAWLISPKMRRLLTDLIIVS